MGGRGPVPKPAAQRRRRNATPGARTLQLADTPDKVPPLPQIFEEGWHPLVVAWWRDSWLSPMAAEWTESDIHGMYLLAVLEHTFYAGGGSGMTLKELASEIRLQRQCFGLTPIDRHRLRWEIERGESAGEATTKRRTPAKGTTSGRKDPRLKAVN